MVRAPNWIGDAVMCTPALQSLRDAFPSATITLWARKSIVDLLRGHPAFDNAIVYDHLGIHRSLTGKWRLVQTLRAGGFDIAILFQNAFEAALLSCLARIPVRHGYATDGRSALLTDSVEVPPHKPPVHQVRYYQRLLEPLVGTIKESLPSLHVCKSEEQPVFDRMRLFGMDEDDWLIGLNPGSVYGSAKRWPADRFAATADRLQEILAPRHPYGQNVRCVIVGGHGEEQLGCAIAKRMKHAPVVLSGKTSLRELMVVIKRCRLFLTNDTGPMHIASAFGVPLVAIFGPTDHLATSPFGANHAMVRKPVTCSPCLLRACPIDHRCMTNISVEQVVQVCLEQLRLSAALSVMG